MLRADNVICGTSTTGTGTLTLAACPSGVGGIDPYIAFSTQGFGTSVAIPGTWTITEYTDSTFSKPKQIEKVIGSLLLGASIGACTLARTTVQYTQTGLDTGTPSYTIGGSPITIGVAANVLVAIEASAMDVLANNPYFEQTQGDGVGINPFPIIGNVTSNAVASGTDIYVPFFLTKGMLVRRASVRVGTAYTGGTSSVNLRLYAVGNNGRPGKLLVDLGYAGSSTAGLNSGGTIITTSAATPGAYLPAGADYFLDILPVFSGGSGAPALSCVTRNTAAPYSTILGTQFLTPLPFATATGGTAGAAPDPANVTSYATSTAVVIYLFTLNNQ